MDMTFNSSEKNAGIYQLFIRPLLFRMDPEFVHIQTLKLLSAAGRLKPVHFLLKKSFDAHSQRDLSVNAFGLRFPNPVGLAAGYDKDGAAWRGLETLGFGHVEIGTITPFPQYGNPKPRVFRIPEEEALINRMGFPGRGVEYLRERIAQSRISPTSTILGINIGKNGDTPIEDAAVDYLNLFNKLYDLADYIVVNVSSPNTIGLRRLQARHHLEILLKELSDDRIRVDTKVPILVKISPDLTEEELDDVVGTVVDTEMDGIIAVNTTVNREQLGSPLITETGGLSGTPLTDISRRFVSDIYRKTGGKLPIVGVGGIMTPDQAKSMLDAGALLIQIFTGLIYSGPGLVKNILKNL